MQNKPGLPTSIEQFRQREIIEATISTLAEEGYAGTSLAKIARRAGIAKSAVLYHFSGKDELLRATVRWIYGEIWGFMEPRLTGETTAGGRLRAYLESEFAFLEQHRGQLLALSAILPNHRDAEGRLQLLEEARDVFMRVICDIFKQGQTSGEFRAFELKPMAATLMHAVNGALEEWVKDPDLSLSAYSKELVILFDLATRRRIPTGGLPDEQD
jgi:AcrR family transcriptional regulator